MDVQADNATTQADITTFTTSASASEMTATAQSIDATGSTNNDEALFEDATTTDMSNYAALHFFVYITAWNDARHEVELRARNGGTDVGVSVNLSDFVETSTLNQWQSVVINKTLMNLETQTIDEFVMLTTSTTGGGPDYFVDRIRWEENGTPVLYTFAPPP